VVGLLPVLMMNAFIASKSLLCASCRCCSAFVALRFVQSSPFMWLQFPDVRDVKVEDEKVILT